MLCLFYVALGSEKNGHNVGTAVVPEKRFFFPHIILFYIYFLVLIPNVQFIPQFISVIATNNDLLTDELNVIYFAPNCGYTS